MKFEGLIFTLFLVGILLTLGIANNITGLAVSSYSSGESCSCVKLPVCTKEGVMDVCLGVKSQELKTELISIEGEGIKIAEPDEGKAKALVYIPDVEIEEELEEKEEPKEELKCPDRCGPFNLPSNSPTPFIYHYKEIVLSNRKVCAIDNDRPPVSCTLTYGPTYECVLINGIGECKETYRAKKAAGAYAGEEEGDATYL